MPAVVVANYAPVGRRMVVAARRTEPPSRLKPLAFHTVLDNKLILNPGKQNSKNNNLLVAVVSQRPAEVGCRACCHLINNVAGAFDEVDC